MAARFFQIKVVKLGGYLDNIKDIVGGKKIKESQFQLKEEYEKQKVFIRAL